MKQEEYIFAPYQVLSNTVIPSPRDILERKLGKEKADEFFRKHGDYYWEDTPWHGWLRIDRGTTTTKLETQWPISYETLVETRSKRLIPGIQIVDELPQWIISSDIAAYHPWSRTIWLKRRSFCRMTISLIHELVHHLIEVLGGGPHIHRSYDRLCVWLLCRKTK